MSSMKFVNEPVMIITPDGEVEPYIPINVKTNRDAYSASLDMIFKHVAEFHVTIVKIIADKYGLDENEIINEVRNDDRFLSITNITNGLGYVDDDLMKTEEEEEPKIIRKAVKRRINATIPVEAEIVEDEPLVVDDSLYANMEKMKIDASPADTPPIKKRIYKKKTVVIV